MLIFGGNVSDFTLAATGVVFCLVLAWTEQRRRKAHSEKEIMREWLRREHAQNQHYQHLFDGAADFIVIIDPRGRFASISRAAAKTTGDPRDEAFHLNLDRFVAPEHRDLVRKMIEETVAGKSAPTYRITIFAKDGHRVALEASTSLVPAHSPLMAIACTAHDVTEQRPEKPCEVRRTVEAEGQAKSEILAKISCQIRTYVSGILGMANVALGTELGAEQREYLESIGVSAQSLMALVEQTLEFSENRMGTVESSPSKGSVANRREEAG